MVLFFYVIFFRDVDKDVDVKVVRNTSIVIRPQEKILLGH